MQYWDYPQIASLASNDIILVWDASAGQNKTILASNLGSALVAGVSSINGATGAMVFNGSGVSQTGNTFTFSGGGGGGGSGTVTSVAVSNVNGVSGIVTNPNTDAVIAITLGNISPSSVNGITLSGSSSPQLAVSGTSSISGVNTGDQTNITGNAATATKLANARTISVTGDGSATIAPFDGTGNVSGALTLSTVNSNIGTFGGTGKTVTLTVNGKGLVTAASENNLTKSDIGLGNVDNTSDLNKPLSIATAAAIVNKVTKRSYWDFIEDFSADNTGVSDNSAILQSALSTIASAGGGRLFCPAGTYLFSRALQDIGVNGANAQVPLPNCGTSDIFGVNSSAQVTIEIHGASAAPFSGESTVALSAGGHTIFKSTLTGTTGTGALIGSVAPRNNLRTIVHDLVVQLPPNPSVTGLNFSNTQDVEIRRCLIYTGTTRHTLLTQPTSNVSQCGIIMPKTNNSANCILDSVYVIAMYSGFYLGELSTVVGCAAQSCIQGWVIPFALHPNTLVSIGAWECKYGIVAAGDGLSFLQCSSYAIEWDSTQASWQQPVAHLYDPNELLKGELKWHISKDSAVSSNFKLVGGGGVRLEEEGVFSGSILLSSAEIGSVADDTLSVTFGRSAKAVDFTAGVSITVNGTPTTPSSTSRAAAETINYVLPAPVLTTDVVVFNYTNLDGSLADGDGVAAADGSVIALNSVLPGTPLIRDSFIGTNGTALASHTISPTNTPATSWTDNIAGLKIESNKAQLTNGGATSTVDAGVADCTLRVNVSMGVGAVISAGFYARFQDASNVVLCVINTFSNTIELSKWTAGVRTVLSNAPITWTPGNTYPLQLTMSGTSLTGTWNGGATVITATSSEGLTRTRHGIHADGTPNIITLDDFIVA